MLYKNTLNEIRTNVNTGVEYEIALFYRLLSIKPEEQKCVWEQISQRRDRAEINRILSITSTRKIDEVMRSNNVTLVDVSFETQNDDVGPADIILYYRRNDRFGKLGLSVKYANTCTLNVTGRKFITDAQIESLKNKYVTTYLPKYISDMQARFGNASNWHRKKSTVTDEMIDEIRDAVIENWPYVNDKASLLSVLFHAQSPIHFWVVTYDRNGYELKTRPSTIDMSRANEVVVQKYQTSYVAFFLDNKRVAHMQVKFNNGFIEKNERHNGSKKKQNADFIRDGIEFVYGQPFGSWNFSVEK